MSTTGDCNHKSCDRYRKCRWPYLIAYRSANQPKINAWIRGYRAGKRKTRKARETRERGHDPDTIGKTSPIKRAKELDTILDTIKRGAGHDPDTIERGADTIRTR